MSDEKDFGLHPFRLEVKGQLVTESPLHLGDGGERPLKEEQGEESPRLATILRGAGGLPFIPGSSLKGMLRGLAGENAADRLFGTAKTGAESDKGQMGQLIVWGSLCTPASPGDAPYACPARGSFAAARTALAPKTGTAEEHKLFFQEMLAPGTLIPLELLVVADSQDALDKAWSALLPLLARLAQGAQLGKGKTDGQGRVRLQKEGLSAIRLSLKADGQLHRTPEKIPPLVCEQANLSGTWTLSLTCDGPFAILDSSVKSSGGSEGPQLKAQSLSGDMPHIPGTSLMGALRAQADWLNALAPVGGSPVEALFGTTGQRARLALESLEVTAATAWEITSVKLDRFSGGPIDGGLFTTRTYVGVRATARLRLDDKEPAHLAFVERLIDHLKNDGLLLGHGTNKGFGWFTVTVEEGKNG